MEKELLIHTILNDRDKSCARFLLTINGEVLACNRYACFLFKYQSQQEMIGIHYKEMVTEDFAENLPPLISLEHLTNGQFLPRVNRCADNSSFPSLVKTQYNQIENEVYVECYVKPDQEKFTSIQELNYRQITELLKCEIMRLKNDSAPSIDIKYMNQALASKLTMLHPQVKPKEIAFCSMLLNGIQTKAISDMLCMTIESGYKFRKRLRKKMKLSSDVDLFQYLKDLMLSE